MLVVKAGLSNMEWCLTEIAIQGFALNISIPISSFKNVLQFKNHIGYLHQLHVSIKEYAKILILSDHPGV